MLSDKEILLLHKKDIASDCAEVARFKGNVMSMGKIGEMKVYNKITSRLNKRLDEYFARIPPKTLVSLMDKASATLSNLLFNLLQGNLTTPQKRHCK